MKNEVRQLTVGAVVSAMVAVMFLLDRFTGGFIALYYLLILPVILVIYREFAGMKYTIITGIAIWLLIYLMTGSLPVMVSAFGYIIVGWVWCYMEAKQYKTRYKIMISMLIIGLVYFVQIRFFSTFFFASDESYDALAIQLINEAINNIIVMFGAKPFVFGNFEKSLSLAVIYSLTALLETFVITVFSDVLKLRLSKVIVKYKMK